MRPILFTLLLLSAMSVTTVKAQLISGEHRVLDGPGMVAINPTFYAGRLYDAWQSARTYSREDLERLVGSFEVNVLDRDEYVIGDDDEEFRDEQIENLVFYAGSHCKAVRTVVETEDGDAVEMLDFQIVNVDNPVALVVAAARYKTGAENEYCFGIGDSMIRLAFASENARDQVFMCLLDCDNFSYKDDDECYVRIDEDGEDDWGVVLRKYGESSNGMYWLDITSFL